MEKNMMTGKQMKYVIAFFLIGSSLVQGTTSNAGQDSWITIILAVISVIPLIFVYNAILRLYPGNNLYDILIKIFGKIVGRIFCLIYTFYAVHLGSLVMNIFAEFVHIVGMPETPRIFITCWMLSVCIYMAYKGLSNIGRISKFLYSILVASVIITVLASIQNIDFNYIKPILNTKIPILLNTSFNAFALPYAEMIIFTTLFSSIKPKENYKKIFFHGLLLGSIILLIANIRNILTLGPISVKTYPFASYESISLIAIGEFFTRIEVIIGIDLLLAGFIKVCVCCYSSAIGMAKILNVSEYKYLVVPCVLLMIMLVGMSFENSIETFEFIEYYKYYVLSYQVILPIIILIAGKIKKKIESRKIDSNDITDEIYSTT